MLRSVFLFLACGYLGVSAHVRGLNSRGVRAPQSDVYRKLQARVVPMSLSPTRTTPLVARKVQPVKSNNRHKREVVFTVRIAAALKHCLETVHHEAANIRKKCKEGGSTESIVAAVLPSLNNILKAVQNAVTEIHDSESAPTPSGSYQTPPTLPDICQLLLQLIRCIHSILLQLIEALKSPETHEHFGEILTQINDSIGKLISEINSKLPGAISTLADLGKEVFDTIRFEGFGFSSIINLVRPL